MLPRVRAARRKTSSVPFQKRFHVAPNTAEQQGCERQDILCLALECEKELRDFFKAVLARIGDGMERRLLDYLIGQERPVNPRQAGKDLGRSDIKPAADTLCYLGMVSRWIRDEEATLSAGCQLFNEWYLKKDH